MASSIGLQTARLALLVSIFALLGVAAEVACRILEIPFGRQSTKPSGENSLARFDDELGWSYIPNHSASVTYGEPPREIAIHFDERGLRAPAAGQRLDPSQPTLLFVGGSFTMGHGVIHQASFPARVNSGRFADCQIANAGVQGFGTDQSLLALRRHLGAFETVAVIYTYMDAHLQRNGNRDRRLLYPRERFVGTKPVFVVDAEGRPVLAHSPAPLDDYVFSHLAAFVRLRLPPPKPVDLTRQLIRAMRRDAEAAGAVFIAIDWGWPQGGRDRPSIFGPLETEGMRVLYTEDAPPQDWRYMVIPGTGHPTVQAHGIVAQRLRVQLARARVNCDRSPP